MYARERRGGEGEREYQLCVLGLAKKTVCRRAGCRYSPTLSTDGHITYETLSWGEARFLSHVYGELYVLWVPFIKNLEKLSFDFSTTVVVS